MEMTFGEIVQGGEYFFKDKEKQEYVSCMACTSGRDRDGTVAVFVENMGVLHVPFEELLSEKPAKPSKISLWFKKHFTKKGNK